MSLTQCDYLLIKRLFSLSKENVGAKDVRERYVDVLVQGVGG